MGAAFRLPTSLCGVGDGRRQVRGLDRRCDAVLARSASFGFFLAIDQDDHRNRDGGPAFVCDSSVDDVWFSSKAVGFCHFCRQEARIDNTSQGKWTKPL